MPFVFLVLGKIDLSDKVHIYHTCILSILLWVVETWAMIETHQKRLETFHYRSIRSILGLRMKKIKEEKITNDDGQRRFCKIPTISEIIMKQKLAFIGHVIREWAAPSAVVTVWLQDKRPRGRPWCTAWLTILMNIRKILPDHALQKG